MRIRRSCSRPSPRRSKHRAVADLRLKRAYDAPAPDDGLRVLVDRLWPRGLSRDKARIGLWLKAVAPGDELRRWFGHAPGGGPNSCGATAPSLPTTPSTLPRCGAWPRSTNGSRWSLRPRTPATTTRSSYGTSSTARGRQVRLDVGPRRAPGGPIRCCSVIGAAPEAPASAAKGAAPAECAGRWHQRRTSRRSPDPRATRRATSSRTTKPHAIGCRRMQQENSIQEAKSLVCQPEMSSSGLPSGVHRPTDARGRTAPGGSEWRLRGSQGNRFVTTRRAPRTATETIGGHDGPRDRRRVGRVGREGVDRV